LAYVVTRDHLAPPETLHVRIPHSCCHHCTWEDTSFLSSCPRVHPRHSLRANNPDTPQEPIFYVSNIEAAGHSLKNSGLSQGFIRSLTFIRYRGDIWLRGHSLFPNSSVHPSSQVRWTRGLCDECKSEAMFVSRSGSRVSWDHLLRAFLAKRTGSAQVIAKS
jgi:hypothetical protein